MFKSEYESHLRDREAEAKETERVALDQSVTLLKAAKDAGSDSKSAIEAVYFTQRLWTLLLEDLASPENGLPRELRAQIISIGIWILRECEKIRGDQPVSFDDLISVSETIRDAMK